MSMNKNFELDLWTDKLDRFMTEFSALNDVKFDHMEAVDSQGLDTVSYTHLTLPTILLV